MGSTGGCAGVARLGGEGELGAGAGGQGQRGGEGSGAGVAGGRRGREGGDSVEGRRRRAGDGARAREAGRDPCVKGDAVVRGRACEGAARGARGRGCGRVGTCGLRRGAGAVAREGPATAWSERGR